MISFDQLLPIGFFGGVGLGILFYGKMKPRLDAAMTLKQQGMAGIWGLFAAAWLCMLPTFLTNGAIKAFLISVTLWGFCGAFCLFMAVAAEKTKS